MIYESEKLKTHLDELPPQKLYHYTSTEAFRCIIEFRTLWASDIFYLNDQQEIVHAIDLLQMTCKSLAKDKNRIEITFLEKLVNELEFHKKDQPHIFTASFSASRDQLSQWRAYSQSGGYALAFNGSVLSRIAQAQGYQLVRCIYEESDKVKIFKECVFSILSRLNPNEIDLIVENSAKVFLEVAAMMKHKGFAEENEWRLISTGRQNMVSEIKYRSNTKYLIPFREIALESQNILQKGDSRNYIGIVEVMVGPAPVQELSWRSCMRLLTDRDIYFEQITPSSTPFRVG